MADLALDGVYAESGWYFLAINKYCFFMVDFDVGVEI